MHSAFATGGSDNPVVRVGLCEGAGTRLASLDVLAGIQIQGNGELSVETKEGEGTAMDGQSGMVYAGEVARGTEEGDAAGQGLKGGPGAWGKL